MFQFELHIFIIMLNIWNLWNIWLFEIICGVLFGILIKGWGLKWHV